VKLPEVKHTETLDLLQATVDFLPQAESILHDSQVKLWNTVLAASAAEFRSAEPRPTRLVGTCYRIMNILLCDAFIKWVALTLLALGT
jgi:hypothetical protein